MQVTNYQIRSSFMSALFVLPPPVHFMFASSPKMFGAIKAWDYHFPLVGAKANSSIFTSVFLQIVPKIAAKSIWTWRVTSHGVNTRWCRYGMRSILSLSHIVRKKKPNKSLNTWGKCARLLFNTHLSCFKKRFILFQWVHTAFKDCKHVLVAWWHTRTRGVTWV